MVRQFVVYGLVDPRDGLIHYVGSCVAESKRPHSHWGRWRRSGEPSKKKNEWLKDLELSGAGRYTVRILETIGALMPPGPQSSTGYGAGFSARGRSPT